MIGMWGSEAAGKTTYLSALYFEVVQRFKSDNRWAMRGNSESAHKLIVTGYEDFAAQRFPTPTNSENSIEPLDFTITKPIGGSAAPLPPVSTRVQWWTKILTFLSRLSEGGSDVMDVDLSLFDPSGELFRTPQKLRAEGNDVGAACGRLLSNSNGLLCMIDPDRQDGQHYFPLIYRNFVELSTLMNGPGGGPLPIPVAICITKSDKYPQAFNDPEGFLCDRMQIAAFAALSSFCRQRAYFAVSAIGEDNLFTDDKGVVRPKGEPKPVNVLQPIEWLANVMR